MSSDHLLAILSTDISLEFYGHLALLLAIMAGCSFFEVKKQIDFSEELHHFEVRVQVFPSYCAYWQNVLVSYSSYLQFSDRRLSWSETLPCHICHVRCHSKSVSWLGNRNDHNWLPYQSSIGSSLFFLLSHSNRLEFGHTCPTCWLQLPYRAATERLAYCHLLLSRIMESTLNDPLLKDWLPYRSRLDTSSRRHHGYW